LIGGLHVEQRRSKAAKAFRYDCGGSALPRKETL
jgi:hypothetical protein